jgi:hypothetical protein
MGTRVAALVCVHGAHVHGGGRNLQGVAIVPAHLLHGALGDNRALSDADVALLTTSAGRGSARPPEGPAGQRTHGDVQSLTCQLVSSGHAAANHHTVQQSNRDRGGRDGG